MLTVQAASCCQLNSPQLNVNLKTSRRGVEFELEYLSQNACLKGKGLINMWNS